MSEPAAPLKVLSIVGAGRSGTTVLASILGEAAGFTAAGEIRWLWRRGVLERRPCACGAPPEECPVWGPVVDETLQPLDGQGRQQALESILAAQDEVGSSRHRLRVLRSAGAATPEWPALDVVRRAYGTACRALAAATGARVVVDTSKRPHDAAVFAALPGVSHYVLHVVRDPRAVTHSWRRAKSFTVAGQTRSIGTRRLPATVSRWTSNAVGSELLRRYLPRDRWLRLRYEDFCAAPRQAYDAIVALLGEEAEPPFVAPDAVRLSPSHIVAGNPSRFTVGTVQIRADEEWRGAMSRRDQRLVGGATYPLRRRYGYA
jgi:hypothetical protein